MADQMAYLQPMSPPSASSGRPSSRRALTRALELAQEAVRIDATGEDPQAAVMAYAKSVALLNEVMERVMRGEDTESSRRKSSSRKSVVAKEDEARRLRSIHDTYYDRMQILVMIYGIPPPNITTTPPSSVSTYSSFPTTPQSRPDISRPAAQTLLEKEHVQIEAPNEVSLDGVEGIGSAMLTGSVSPGGMTPDTTEYTAHVTPRASPPGAPLSTRTNHLPPMRQPPAGPPPIRPRKDSLPRRQSRLGPPSLPPTVAPPPVPIPAVPAAYDIATPSVESHRQHGVPRDVQYDDGEILDDWEDIPQDAADRLARMEEEEEIRRNYLAPTPRRKNTSDSEGSMSRHHQAQHDITHAFTGQQQHDYQDLYYTHTHPYAQPAASNHPEETHHPYASRPPTPANRSRGNTQSSTTSSRSAESSAFSDRPRTPPPVPQLVSNTTAQGTISQRRKVNTPMPGMAAVASSAGLDVNEPQHPPLSRSHSPATTESTTTSHSTKLVPMSPASVLSAIPSGRHRAASQPGRRPSLIGMHATTTSDNEHPPSVPPVPQTAIPRKTSFTSPVPPLPAARIETSSLPHYPSTSGTPQTPVSLMTATTGPLSALSPSSTIAPMPLSPLPGPPPSDTARRPYHLMHLLYMSITSPSGGYVTRKLHVPHDVWTQGGAKLNNVADKGKCIAILETGLDDLAKASHDFIRAPQSNAGLAGPGIARAMGERWLRALDEWTSVCDGVIGTVGKKLGLRESLASKKTAGWGNKVSRTFDRMTNGKNLDSPTDYVQGLAHLFSDVQLFDEHHKLLAASAGSYGLIPLDIRSQIEARLKRSSEFFATVVIDFVIRDLGQLLDKYAKKGEKWMEE
ncbi:hypothetical protein FRB99_005479 [Tulasnella sp. 403]|nr:hypothetical protein FRB99_005479 [Tulasnella sp. 403]